MHSVLLVGVPRGGTTWVGQVLAHTRHATYVHEPDGTHDPFAFRAKLGQFNEPMIDGDAPRATAPDLAALFDGALAGGAPAGTWRDQLARKAWSRVTIAEKSTARRTGRLSPQLRIALALSAPRAPVREPEIEHTIVKSVNISFCAEWVVRHCRPAAVGVIARHPFNVLASWRDFGWTAPYGPEYRAIRARARARWQVELPPPDAAPIARAAAVAGALAFALHEARGRHAEWVPIDHEALCVDPATRFRALAARLGLEWTDDADAYVAGTDRPGEGYATQRVTAEQPDRWRARLEPDEIEAARDVLVRFPDAPWLGALA